MPLRDHFETIADDLRDPLFVTEYLQVAWADGMPTFVVALRNLTKARFGMARLAEITGMSRERLSEALSPSGDPHLATIRSILQALGYDLKPDNDFAVSRGADASEAISEPASAAA
jgi:probable addiction module antidote protein